MAQEKIQTKVLILGGYGVFGSRIAQGLAARAPDGTPSLDLLIGGRDAKKCAAFAKTINAIPVCVDVTRDLAATLQRVQPDIVINCCGPFQGQDYQTARLCITAGTHYIDLADGRDYVAGFTALDALAKAHDVTAVTGASSVPAISACVLDHFAAHDFAEMQTLDYAITPGNQTERGEATVAGILSYVGQPFTTLIDGRMQRVTGWHDLHRHTYPVFGTRLLSNCDIPDLAVFPQHYPSLRTIRFYAGLELPVLHLGVWLLSWLTAWKLVKNWQPYAALLRRMSLWFYRFGSQTGGMHVTVTGLDTAAQPLRKTFYLIAHGGDGPQIPAAPAIVLALVLTRKTLQPGAFPCIGLFTLDDLLSVLKPYRIESRFA